MEGDEQSSVEALENESLGPPVRESFLFASKDSMAWFLQGMRITGLTQVLSQYLSEAAPHDPGGRECKEAVGRRKMCLV